MKSPKSDSNSKSPLRKYRLYRTLKRRPTFRDFTADDIKYLWALYRKGGLSGLFEDGLEPEEFREAFAQYVSNIYDLAWTLEAKTSKGFMHGLGVRPVGNVFGLYFGKMILVSEFLWFPWASKRNKVETAIHFINQMRKEHVLCGWVPMREPLTEHNFLVHIARHGIIRRVGTLHDLMEEPAAFFQSRKPQWQAS